MDELYENLEFDFDKGLIYRNFKNGKVVCYGNETTCKNGGGYYRIRLNRKQYTIHRLIYSKYHGIPLESLGEIDHINRIRTDNKIENLRQVSKSHNCLNRRKPITNISGYKHITYDKQRNKWRFRIVIKNKSFQKRFSTIQEAVQYRDKFYQEHPEILFGNQ